MNKITHITIDNSLRERYGLSFNEYVIAYIVTQLQANPDNQYEGWCTASKKDLGRAINITEQGVHKLLARLYKLGIVEKNPTTKYIRTTEKWRQVC